MTDILERTVNLSTVAETKAEREYYYDVAEEISNLRTIKAELRALGAKLADLTAAARVFGVNLPERTKRRGRPPAQGIETGTAETHDPEGGMTAHWHKSGTKADYVNDINEWMQRVCKDETRCLTRPDSIVLEDLKRLCLAILCATDLERPS